MNFFIGLVIVVVIFLILIMALAIYSSLKMNKISENILLYDANKVTIDDCILMDKCYGKKAIINDGSVLEFKQE